MKIRHHDGVEKLFCCFQVRPMVITKCQISSVHLVFFALLSCNDCFMVFVNTIWKGSKLPYVVSDVTIVTYLLSFTPNTWIYLAPLLSHLLSLAIGTTCTPVWFGLYIQKGMVDCCWSWQNKLRGTPWILLVPSNPLVFYL